jgi:hypothetical protein
MEPSHFCQLHPRPISPRWLCSKIAEQIPALCRNKLPRAGCEFQLVPILRALHLARSAAGAHEFITCNFICCAEQTHVNYERWWKWSRVYFASLFSGKPNKNRRSAGEELTIKCEPLYLQRTLEWTGSKLMPLLFSRCFLYTWPRGQKRNCVFLSLSEEEFLSNVGVNFVMRIEKLLKQPSSKKLQKIHWFNKILNFLNRKLLFYVIKKCWRSRAALDSCKPLFRKYIILTINSLLCKVCEKIPENTTPCKWIYVTRNTTNKDVG